MRDGARGLLLGFDVSIEVPRRGVDRVEVGRAIIAALSDAGASSGSMLRQPRRRAIEFGSWSWITIVVPDVGGRDRLDDDGVPRNHRVDSLMAELDDALAGSGSVRSWSVFDDVAVLYLAGGDVGDLRVSLESARHVLPVDAFMFDRNGTIS